MPIKQIHTSDTKELYNRIYELFFQYSLTNVKMLRIFYIENFLVIEYKLKTIRLDFNLYRRYNIERL